MGTQIKRKSLEHHQIDWQRKQLSDREATWLRLSGWKETCSTPGSFWMWKKDWDGKTFLVHQPDAARIQGHWDAERDYKEHPDDYED